MESKTKILVSILLLFQPYKRWEKIGWCNELQLAWAYYSPTQHTSVLPRARFVCVTFCFSPMPLFTLFHRLWHLTTQLPIITMGCIKLTIKKKTLALAVLKQGLSVIRVAVHLNVITHWVKFCKENRTLRLNKTPLEHTWF